VEREAIATRTGLRLGPDQTFIHAATGQVFVLVPAGAFIMGMTAGELVRALREIDYDPRIAEWREHHKALHAAASPRGVVEQAFLCGRTPLLVRAAEAAQVPWSTHETSAGTGPTVAVELTAPRAARAVAHHGWQLLRDSQWEYIARAGGDEWAGGPTWRAAIDQQVEDPRFDPVHCNRWGIWGLGLGEWVCRGAVEVPDWVRGGGVLHAPWQDSDEAMSCHVAAPGNDGKWRRVFRVRPVIPLPWLHAELEPPEVAPQPTFDAVLASLEAEHEARRAAAEAARARKAEVDRAIRAREARLAAEAPGSVQEGTIRSVGDDGVYVVRLAEMNGILRRPGSGLAVGDRVRVRIIGTGGVPELELAGG
jgi:hypothetical protein